MATDNGYTCTTVEQAKKFLALMGFVLPDIEEQTILLKLKGGRIIAETTVTKDVDIPGWGRAYRKLQIAFGLASQDKGDDFDNAVRHIVDANSKSYGFLVMSDDGNWMTIQKGSAEDVLASKFALSKSEMPSVMGRIIRQPYVEKNLPLQPRFVVPRIWNRYGAQLAVDPIQGEHPNFDKIFNHVGRGLDDAVKGDDWCKLHRVISGSRYLWLWYASVIQQPTAHLPFLYLYSYQRDNGKSAFHRGPGKMFRTGYTEGTPALNGEYNQQLAGGILVYVDESVIKSENKQKIKNNIDAPYISIRRMHTDPFMLDNYTHWIGCFNDKTSIPVETDDQRIVMFEVPPLLDDDKIPWLEFEPLLKRELPALLYTLQHYELLPAAGRLYLPILSTPLKEEVMEKDDNQDIEQLRAAMLNVASGEYTSAELLERLGKGWWSASPNILHHYVKRLKMKTVTYANRAYTVREE